MFKRFSTNYMVLLFLIDVAIVQVALGLGMRLRFLLPFGDSLHPQWVPEFVYIPTPSLHVAVGLIWAASLTLGSAYTPRRIVVWFEEFQRVFFSHTVAALCFAGLLYMIKRDLSRLTFVYFYILALGGLLGYRLLLRVWFRAARHTGQGVTRVLIVGAGKVGCDVVERLRSQHWSSLTLVGFLDDDPHKQSITVAGLPVLGRLDDAACVINQHEIDEVIFALPLHAHARLANLVVSLYELPIRIHVVPDYFDLAFHGATIESIGGIPLIGLRDPAIDGFQRFVKRLMDIALAGLGLLLVWPVMAIVALAIKLEDGGPILYRSLRVGENGRLFSMLKFRSMVVEAERLQPIVAQVEDRGASFLKRADDPRITRVGRIIRRTSIDELPQLINVLKGDMSLVGPRPELPWLVESYQPWQRKRFAVPQGITGWWQINGRSDNPMHLHTEQDLYYIQHYSLWLDLLILWRTVGVVLRGRGAY
ncbi:MAG TPA: sugar transferase [Caldilineaceae bacterium]|nr:sugar transferase [Caldilineaceae bacterium]